MERALEDRFGLRRALLEANLFVEPRIYVRRMLMLLSGATLPIGLYTYFYWTVPLSLLGLFLIPPHYLLPLLLITFLPFFNLKLRASVRSADIARNAPFMAMIFTVGTALRASPAVCFEEMWRNSKLWGPLAKEARRYKSYQVLSDETTAYIEYAQVCPNSWLKMYMQDLVSNIRAGGDLYRLTREKLDDAIDRFERDTSSRAEFLTILSGAAMLMYATLPLIILSMALMFVSLGGSGQSELLITATYILLATSVLFIPLGEIVKPSFEYRIDNDLRFLGLSVALPLATFGAGWFLRLRLDLLLYFVLLGLGIPLMVFFLRADRMNIAMLTSASRFMFDLQERFRYGVPVMVAISKLSERNYSKPFDAVIRRLTRNVNLLGIATAFQSLYGQTNNDYVRKLFGLIEFTHRSGAEDPTIYYTFDQFFRRLIGSIQNFRRNSLTYSIIAAMGVVVMVIGVWSMLAGTGQLELLGAGQAAAIRGITANVKLLIPLVSFASGFLAGYFSTGKIFGAFREGTILTALAFSLTFILGIL